MSGPHSLYLPGSVDADFFPRACMGAAIATASNSNSSDFFMGIILLVFWTAFNLSPRRPRERDLEHGPSRPVGGLDRSPVSLHDGLDDGQAEPRVTTIFGRSRGSVRKKTVKNLLDVLVGDARPF